jgi:hypothetical protein
MQGSRILLLALLLRAYIPAGYMPVAGSPFRLELCPGHHHVHTGPAQGAHPRHDGHPAQGEDCPFGSAPVAGPALYILAFAPAMAARVIASLPTNSLPPAKPSQRAHSPRGPPPASSV